MIYVNPISRDWNNYAEIPYKIVRKKAKNVYVLFRYPGAEEQSDIAIT